MRLDVEELLLVGTMIERHCGWLNRHAEAEDARVKAARLRWEEPEAGNSGHRYSSTDFASITNEYGYRRVLATTALPSRLVIHVEISDGDEGGPSILTGFHDEITEAFYLDQQTNDPIPSEECDWKRPSNYVYAYSQHRGWELKDLVVEFDTIRTHELADGKLINCPEEIVDAKVLNGTEDGDIGQGE